MVPIPASSLSDSEMDKALPQSREDFSGSRNMHRDGAAGVRETTHQCLSEPFCFSSTGAPYLVDISNLEPVATVCTVLSCTVSSPVSNSNSGVPAVSSSINDWLGKNEASTRGHHHLRPELEPRSSYVFSSLLSLDHQALSLQPTGAGRMTLHCTLYNCRPTLHAIILHRTPECLLNLAQRRASPSTEWPRPSKHIADAFMPFNTTRGYRTGCCRAINK